MTMPVPTLITETCRPCGGVGAVGIEQRPCPTCGGSGRWLRSAYDVRISGELREEDFARVDVEIHLHSLETGRPIDVRCGVELGGAVLERTPASIEKALTDLLEGNHG